MRLKVNGRDLGEMPMTADHVFVLSGVTLRPGENRIEASAGKVKDSCRWLLNIKSN